MMDRFKSIIKYIPVIVLYLFTIIFLISVINLNVVGNFYLFLIVISVVLIDTILGYFLIKGNKVVKVITSIISVLLVILYLTGSIYVNHTSRFLKNITGANYEYRTYNVLVYKNSSYRKIVNLKNQRIGFLMDNYSVNVKTLKNKSNTEFYANSYINAEALQQAMIEDVEAISLEKGYIDAIEEENEEFLDNYRIIYTYRVRVKKDSLKKKVLKDNFILYISGSDSRGSVSDVARSDVNILAVVNTKNKKILLINIPRDYYVQLHGTSGIEDKLTHAGLYGINMSILTIEDLLDTSVDYYLKVGFDTLIESVDLIDGIDITSDVSFTTLTDKECKFVEGVQHVDGKCALAFARERKIYQSGDRHRGENQEQVIAKMLEKLSDTKYLLKYNDILDKLEGSFETDISYKEITNLIKDNFSTLDEFTIDTYNLDGTDSMMPTYTMGTSPLYVMIPDQNIVLAAKEKIKEYLK